MKRLNSNLMSHKKKSARTCKTKNRNRKKKRLKRKVSNLLSKVLMVIFKRKRKWIRMKRERKITNYEIRILIINFYQALTNTYVHS